MNKATDDKETILGCLFGVVLVVFICAIIGFFFSSLWNWIMPVFWPSAPHLGVWQAFGALVLLGWITGGIKIKISTE